MGRACVYSHLQNAITSSCSLLHLRGRNRFALPPLICANNQKRSFAAMPGAIRRNKFVTLCSLALRSRRSFASCRKITRTLSDEIVTPCPFHSRQARNPSPHEDLFVKIATGAFITLTTPLWIPLWILLLPFRHRRERRKREKDLAQAALWAKIQ
jgi:hypothetical protein